MNIIYIDKIIVVVYLVKLVNRGYSMSEKKAIFFINILKNTINVYFDTFFVFYFFKVANYEVLPLAKYYLTLYLFIFLAVSCGMWDLSSPTRD